MKRDKTEMEVEVEMEIKAGKKLELALDVSGPLHLYSMYTISM
jgi:hypothetical protein